MSTIDKKYLADLERFGKRIEKMGKQLRLMKKRPEEGDCGHCDKGLKEIESVIWGIKGGDIVWDVDRVYAPEYSRRFWYQFCEGEFTVKYKVYTKEQPSYPYPTSSEYKSCEAELVARPTTNPPRQISYEEYLENEFPDESKCKNIIGPWPKRLCRELVIGKIPQISAGYRVGEYELDLIIISVNMENEKNRRGAINKI